jgi:hypothetical protein
MLFIVHLHSSGQLFVRQACWTDDQRISRAISGPRFGCEVFRDFETSFSSRVKTVIEVSLRDSTRPSESVTLKRIRKVAQKKIEKTIFM